MDQVIANMSMHGTDGRAIYAALAMYHAVYYQLGVDSLGASYMSRLEDQGVKLAEATLKRR